MHCENPNKLFRQPVSRRSFGAAAVVLLFGGRRLLAEESAGPFATEVDAMKYLSSKTSGGKQFWAEVIHSNSPLSAVARCS